METLPLRLSRRDVLRDSRFRSQFMANKSAFNPTEKPSEMGFDADFLTATFSSFLSREP